MAGLNFSTTTIINAIPETAEAVVSKGILRLGRGVDLKLDNITNIRKTVAEAPVMCQAKIEIPTDEGDYRLDVVLGTDGAAPLIFAAPQALNGTAFWVGIHVDDAFKVADLADAINKKYKTFVMGERLLNATADGTALVLEGLSEYLRFRKCELVKFTAATETSLEKTEVISDTDTNVIEKGKNGFGTYSHIIKDLRLPTAANTGYLHLRLDETPTPGANYTQYIFDYEAKSLVRGTQVVGSINHSHTQHVAWVIQSEVDKFDNLLGDKIVDDGATTGVETVAPNTIELKIKESLED